MCQPQLQGQQVQNEAGVTPVGALVHMLQLHYLRPIPNPHVGLHLHAMTRCQAHVVGYHIAIWYQQR